MKRRLCSQPQSFLSTSAHSGWSSMAGVPLKTPPVHEVRAEATVLVPDYLSILQETEYDFSLESWVLTGFQDGSSPERLPSPSTTSSCPPYWMMFSSPQQSRLASRHSSDYWEPNPRQRSHSLNPAVLRSKRLLSDSEDEGEARPRASGEESPAAVQRKAPRAFVPDLLNPPSCLSSLPHRRRKNLRHCSCSKAEQHQADQHTKISSSVHRILTCNSSNTRLLPQDSSGRPGAPPRLGLAGPDSSAELLAALSPEERELLEAITAQGFSLRSAIIALQRIGHQSPDKILSYLLACDHLCELGYDMVQVEEALEMFQNCETKAEEFLQLLSQFNEMGFQQNTIKEVLLVHENHRDRALEELMMRVA